MYKIVDTISRRSEWLHHHPELPQKEGLLAVLDPVQVRGQFGPVARVRVPSPDGSSVTLEVDEVSINPDGVVALFFAKVEVAEIPLGSFILPLG